MADPRDANTAQARAADPAASVWVSANAGSGKTKVLIDRVARLLLGDPRSGDQGSPPQKILCLTYTRAAAAEMQNRLFERLGRWALMDDTALLDTLAALTEEREAWPEALPRARRLFAQALETPGGLKIQTIHAFCESLLRRFPVEARVSPQFTLMDDLGAAQLLTEARDVALVSLCNSDDAADREAAGRLLSRASEYTLSALSGSILSMRKAMNAEDEAIRAAHGLEAADDEASVLARLRRLASDDTLARLHSTLSASTDTDRKHANALSLALVTENEQQWLDALGQCLLTLKGEPRKIGNAFFAKAAREAWPDGPEHILAMQQALTEVLDKRRAIALAADSIALARYGRLMIAHYDAAKAARGALDYDDLIERVRHLLTDAGAAGWVLYKLDYGVDHILVDEAQDTSPAQWAIIRAIADEFLSGAGSRSERRTVFAVGDEKQSIYSFQGARPEQFDATRRYFQSRLGNGLSRVDLDFSFRSTRAVLGFVDRVFEPEDAARGLGAEGAPPRHIAYRGDAPGFVELWPPQPAPPKPEDAPWWQPLDVVSAEDPAVMLARTLAAWLKAQIGVLELPARGRALRASDVLILVRRRGTFSSAMIRELKALGLPVAGADRMMLGEQLIVRDLCVLAQVALLPQDDLSLATVLRGPLIGLTEEALFDLAQPRARGLWAELVRRRAEPAYAAAHELLSDVIARADFRRPYEFFERVLSVHGGRERLLGRLGQEAADPLDEFLSMALAYETGHVPTLQGFLAWFTAGTAQIKREMEQGRNEIRLMTVHGAKGLEANLVIVPDTCQLPHAQHTPAILKSDDAPVWCGSKKTSCTATQALSDTAREAQMQEYRRLLYVALTRARDGLILCGWTNLKQKKGPEEGTWWRLAEAAMQGAQGIVTPVTDDSGQMLAGWRLADPPGDVTLDEGDHISAPAAAAPPPWAFARCGAEHGPPPPIAPSRLGGDDPVPPGGPDAPPGGRERGLVVHGLLDALAPLDPGDRAEAAARMGAGGEATDTALAILADPRFAWVFAAGTIAEAPVAGPVAALGGRAISGRIDRLVPGDGVVHLVDFKTGARHDPPPEAYLRQLAVYRAAVSEALHTPVSAWLLWTDTPALVAVPDGLLDDALARLAPGMGAGMDEKMLDIDALDPEPSLNAGEGVLT